MTINSDDLFGFYETAHGVFEIEYKKNLKINYYNKDTMTVKCVAKLDKGLIVFPNVKKCDPLELIKNINSFYIPSNDFLKGISLFPDGFNCIGEDSVIAIVTYFKTIADNFNLIKPYLS